MATLNADKAQQMWAKAEGSQVASAGFKNAMQIAQAFSDLAMRSAQAANAARLKAARTNIRVGSQQIRAAETEERSNIAQALAKHEGTLRVNTAFRGTAGSPSSRAAATSATISAARSASNVMANAAMAEMRLVSENNPQLDDVRLAGIEGALQGFGVGANLQGALSNLQRKFVSPLNKGGTGQTFFLTPGLDLGEVFRTGEWNL